MNSESKKKKAFLVNLEYEIPVLAADAKEAKKFMKEALDNLTGSLDLEDCCEVRPLTYIPGVFEDDDLIYCDNDDVTMKELCEHSPEYQKSILKHNKFLSATNLTNNI